MYKSPIELIYESIQSQLDECIYKEIQKVDIKVDKEELLKALAYDREQYKKGYEDAKAEMENGQWIEKRVDNAEDLGTDMWQSARCSACGYYHTTPYMYCFTKYNYCPHCGAKMDEVEDIPHKCGDCADFDKCERYVDPSETFPEVGGCPAFKEKEKSNDKP